MTTLIRSLDLRGLINPEDALPTYGAEAAELPASSMAPPHPSDETFDERDPFEQSDPSSIDGITDADIEAEIDAEIDAIKQDDTALYWRGIVDPVADARRQLSGFSSLHAMSETKVEPVTEDPSPRSAPSLAGYTTKAGVLVSVLVVGALAALVPHSREKAPASVEAPQVHAPAPVAAVQAPVAAVPVPVASAPAEAVVPVVEEPAPAIAPAPLPGPTAKPDAALALEAFVSKPVPRAQ